MASITGKIYDIAQQLGRFPHFVGSAQLTAGTGAPGADAGPKGSLYIRTDGGTDTTLYVREAAGAATEATGIFSLAGIPVDTETVVIGGVTYTFVDTLAVAFDVLIGVSASATLDNLIAAINDSAGEGSTYGTGTTAHPSVTAAAGTGDTMDVTASTGGVAGNSIGTTTTAADGSWGSPTLTGGVDDDGTGWAAK